MRGQLGFAFDGATSFHDAMTLAARDTADRAWRCIAEGAIVEQPNATMALAQAAMILDGRGRIEITDVLDAALKVARKNGAMPGQALAQIQLAQAWYNRGALAEAEAYVREVTHLVGIAQLRVARPSIAALHADVLMDMGCMDEARQTSPESSPGTGGRAAGADPIARCRGRSPAAAGSRPARRTTPTGSGT